MMMPSITKRALAILMLLWVSTAAQAASQLEALDFRQGSSGELNVEMAFSGPLPEVRGYRLDDPPRLTLDLMGAMNGLERRRFTPGVGGVERVTVLEAGGRTRLVFDLDEALPYAVREQDDRLLVAIGSGEITAAAVSEPERARAEAAAEEGAVEEVAAESAARASAGPSVAEIDFRRGESGAGRLVVTFDRAGVDARVRESGRGQVTAELRGVELPASLDQVYDVSDFGTPLQRITPNVGRDGVTLAIEGRGDFATVSTQSGRQLIIEAQPVTQREREQRVREQFPYTGERITLNFQDIEVRSVLSIIADFTGLNLVASDSVQGRVTLNLNDVPWDQALELILQSRGLARRQQGNVIVVAPAAELIQRERLELESREQMETLAPLVTEYVEVRYARAADLAALLRGEDGFGLLTERGRVAVDQRTNMLLIQDTAEQIDAILRTLDRLDVAVRQVQIEARIVIASETATRELGVNWGVSAARDVRGVFGSSTRDAINLQGASTGLPSRGGLAVDLGPGASGATTFGFGYLSRDILLDLELRALESEGRSYTLSQPRVITANQRAASIRQGQERAFQSIDSQGNPDTLFKEAVLSLEVTPQITPDNRIIMDVVITNDTFGDFQAGQEPPINKNELETQVLVDDGETVVLGGILQTEEIRSMAKTPFLGDLPVLGRLFRYTQESNEKVELLVFITPRILDDRVVLR